ncbi:MAG: hypothetical protein IPH95_12950 [Candidatus Promineofilum sp.]|nr:hypothetical protein [Promineifilum sp.]
MREGGRAIRYRKLMFDRFYALHGGAITFFIDEIDRLLSRIGDEATLLDVMRSASSEETTAGHPKVRFILSGFRLAMHPTNSRDSAWDFAGVHRTGAADAQRRHQNDRRAVGRAAFPSRIRPASFAASIGRRPACPTTYSFTARRCLNFWTTSSAMC